jgi:hypothetical protein
MRWSSTGAELAIACIVLASKALSWRRKLQAWPKQRNWVSIETKRRVPWRKWQCSGTKMMDCYTEQAKFYQFDAHLYRLRRHLSLNGADHEKHARDCISWRLLRGEVFSCFKGSLNDGLASGELGELRLRSMWERMFSENIQTKRGSLACTRLWLLSPNSLDFGFEHNALVYRQNTVHRHRNGALTGLFERIANNEGGRSKK